MTGVPRRDATTNHRRYRAGAMSHLDAFLRNPPQNGETERWVKHAQQTLTALRSGADVSSEAQS